MSCGPVATTQTDKRAGVDGMTEISVTRCHHHGHHRCLPTQSPLSPPTRCSSKDDHGCLEGCAYLDEQPNDASKSFMGSLNSSCRHPPTPQQPHDGHSDHHVLQPHDGRSDHHVQQHELGHSDLAACHDKPSYREASKSPSFPTALYVKCRKLGHGGCGQVWVVKRIHDNHLLAAKVVSLNTSSDRKRHYAMNEPKVLAHCHSPFIVRYVDHWTDHKTAVVTVMEMVDGLDLLAHIRSVVSSAAFHQQQIRRLSIGLPESSAACFVPPADLDVTPFCPKRIAQLHHNPNMAAHLHAAAHVAIPESEALVLFTQVLLGVHHLHAKGIIHRDLKSGNIFLCHNGLVKIGDFGFAVHQDDPVLSVASTAIVGTPGYMAPEIWQQEERKETEGEEDIIPVKKTPPYTVKSDMWALGAILFEMLTGRRLYQPQPHQAQRDERQQPERRVVTLCPLERQQVEEFGRAVEGGLQKYAPDTSPEMTHLVQSLLSVDPTQRPTALGVLRLPQVHRCLKELKSIIAQDPELEPAHRDAAIQELHAVLLSIDAEKRRRL